MSAPIARCSFTRWGYLGPFEARSNQLPPALGDDALPPTLGADNVMVTPSGPAPRVVAFSFSAPEFSNRGVHGQRRVKLNFRLWALVGDTWSDLALGAPYLGAVTERRVLLPPGLSADAIAVLVSTPPDLLPIIGSVYTLATMGALDLDALEPLGNPDVL